MDGFLVGQSYHRAAAGRFSDSNVCEHLIACFGDNLDRLSVIDFEPSVVCTFGGDNACGFAGDVGDAAVFDERADGGAPIFAMVIQRIRELQSGCSVEVLIPDFKGSIEALKIVMDARPEILNHNVETVPRLFKEVQPQDHYEWAQATLTMRATFRMHHCHHS